MFTTPDITRRAPYVSRAISAENPTGAPGTGGSATEGFAARAASRLGRGWKVSPCVEIAAGDTFQIANIEGPGVIQHIWMTVHVSQWRDLLVRMYWDDSAVPAVEVPYGDLFCNGWCEFSQVSSQMVAANPHGGFNLYWPMPFHARARITVENLGERPANLYYQVDYGLGEVATDSLYFHAQWRRSHPVTTGVHTIVSGVRAAGHYVGTYLAWQSNSPGWWGEGEIKFYMDGDQEWPTICGTGTEDYFGGAWNFDVPGAGYTTFTTPYLGLNQVIQPDGLYGSQQRFGMYRWHLVDPVAFTQHLTVTIQALGIGPGQGNGLPHRYRKLTDDIASTALLYLDAPALDDSGRPGIPEILEMETA